MQKDKSKTPEEVEISRIESQIEQLGILTKVASVSGFEEKFAQYLKGLLNPLASHTVIDKAGNVIAIKGRPHTYIFTHMDTIGFMVSSIEEGGLRVVSVKEKGAKPINQPWEVDIFAQNGAVKSTIFPAEDGKEGPLRANDPGVKDNPVRVGDVIALTPNLKTQRQYFVSSQGLDNKLGILAAIEAFENSDNVGFVSTVQEETTGVGAFNAAWSIRPERVIVLDTTYDESDQGIVGPTIGNGPSICLKDSLFPDKIIVKGLRDTATQTGIPIQYEVLESGHSDANRVYNAWGHIPFAFLGIPIKNMHAPNEQADIRDVSQTARLISEFLKQQ